MRRVFFSLNNTIPNNATITTIITPVDALHRLRRFDIVYLRQLFCLAARFFMRQRIILMARASSPSTITLILRAVRLY